MCSGIAIPFHRLSNLFTNSLKATPGVLSTVFKHLAVHKWRRAPFGSGKFWKSLQETLDLVTQKLHCSHPLFELIQDDIANDHGVSGMPVGQVWQLLQRFQEEPIGPKVQMRRWFTIWDVAWSLDRLWHTLLFALVMDYAMDGVDAWDLAGKVIPTIKEDDDKDLKNFKFKQQVLIVLLDKLNQRMLRSYMQIFRRLRLHQSAYTKEGTTPEACFGFSHRLVP